MGFAPVRLSAAGYAEYHPVATNLTAADRGVNRRVDIVILGPTQADASSVQAGSSAGSQTPAAKIALPPGAITPP
jgi:chemotaxis protein MotB